MSVDILIMNYAKQCKMSMPSNNGQIIRYGYINSKKAYIGNTVWLDEDDGTRTGPWTIVFAGENDIPYEEANERSRDWTRSRKATDI